MQAVAIPVAYGPTPSGASALYTLWHDGPSVCDEPKVNKDTAFYNPPGAGPAVTLDKCLEKGASSLPALCVPSSGPFVVLEL